MRMATKALDRLVLALARRRRSREVAVPGLPGCCPPGTAPEAHTEARGGADGLLARRRSLRMALAAVVVAGGVGFPAYLAGATLGSAGAEEAAEEAAYEATADDYTAALTRENATLDAAVAAYSAEREAAGAALPEDVAAMRIREERPGLPEAEVADQVDGGTAAALGGLTPAESAAVEMWAWEPPATEVARESIQAYEAASEAADEAEADYEMAFEDLR